ncbi:hypothetical protein [Micromonospora parathelypteridis]|uniref:Peptide zinc metalloprotease protein n=1 Tax=Micromonospora parathelypteridis TaxID=1839617 RepID=A0A840W7J2_9ACTN|nr:hypothetical protein [Micromonospora parathelypteridis]MBB5480720.1 hypothetical protein [Micromonospora parathelypteridis]GGO21993.1 hypothetical protein GCM10011576_40820 [Micromonospora parathelypteridis]
MTSTLADTTVVRLYPLHIGESEDGVCEVGRVETGDFVELPAEGVDLVRWLGEGLPLGEVRRRFADRYGTEPDLADFLDGIASCGFLRVDAATGDAGTTTTGAGTPPAAGSEVSRRGVALLANLPPHRVSWLLAPPMRLLYVGSWLTVPLLLALVPSLRPTPADAFLLDGVLANALVVAMVAWMLVLLHELAHAATVRALGVTGRLSISRRLWFLVAQTEMSAVRSVPRRRRYAPYLAGLTWDLLLMSACLVLQLAGVHERLVRGVVYTLTLSVVYQFLVFMRTDIYYVLGNWLRLGDLMGDTRRWLANQVRRLVGRDPGHDLGGVPAREVRIIRWYAPFYLLGSLAVTAALLALTAPAMVTMVRLAIDGLVAPVDGLAFWNGVGFLALVALQLATFGWVLVTERRTAA